jgi:hypothetical protein
VSSRRTRITGAVLLAIASLAYLASRMFVLDADQPLWHVVHYSSVDEFHYLMPALNLIRYGTWTYRAAPYAPLYGWPMNVLDNVIGWATLRIWGNTYYGLRMGAVLMGLGMFLATIGAVAAVAKDARRDGALGRLGPLLLTSASALFLLVEFSTLVSSRVAEPGMGRMLALAVLLWLTARRSFLPEDRSRILPTLLLGVFTGAALWFVYVYTAWMVPAVIVTVAVWAWRDRWRGLLRHGAALAAGLLVSTGLYFGFVWLMYGVGPLGWYHTWIKAYDGSGRAAGIIWGALWYVLQSTLFRLNHPLLLLFLLCAGGFLWWAVTLKRPLGVLVGALLVMFEFQALFLSDYWGRKFVVVAPLVVIVIAVGLAWFRPLCTWVLARRRNMVVAIVWILLAGGLYVAATRIPIHFYLTEHNSLVWGTRALAVLAIAIVLAALWRGVPSLRQRWWLGAVAGVLVLAAIVVPSAWADRQYVYGHPTYKYRDTMIAIGTQVDGRVTAGYWSWGMQLYNTSVPQLAGAMYYGFTEPQYVAALTRFFQEGRATSLFAYTTPAYQTKLSGLGFKLVGTYDMNLPSSMMMGRYVFVGHP